MVPFGQPLVKTLLKTLEHPLVPLCQLELLLRSPNFTKTLQNLPM
jgi:hypothetical protein